MVPLPRPISRTATIIGGAITEGRAEEAMHKLMHALRTGGDDKALRLLAADWIERVGLPPGAAKALRRGHPQMREDWLDISEMVGHMQSAGSTYAAAVADTAKHFNCSERHVQNCVADWRRAADDASSVEPNED
jgi:hypothetical protein